MVTALGSYLAMLRGEEAALRDLHERLADGRATYLEWDENLTCKDRHEVSVEESWTAWQDAKAAREAAESNGENT
jgi:hypothetical protein